MGGTEDILSSVGNRMHLAKTNTTLTCRPARWQWGTAFWPWGSAAVGSVCSCVGASVSFLLSRARSAVIPTVLLPQEPQLRLLVQRAGYSIFDGLGPSLWEHPSKLGHRETDPFFTTQV